MGLIIGGCLAWPWGIPQCSAVFIAIGVFAAAAGKMSAREASQAFAEGFRRIALAAALIGIARAVSVILEQGMILDTITEMLFRPFHHLPASGTGINDVDVGDPPQPADAQRLWKGDAGIADPGSIIRPSAYFETGGGSVLSILHADDWNFAHVRRVPGDTGRGQGPVHPVVAIHSSHLSGFFAIAACAVVIAIRISLN
jgi:C4-dicarboxylate anaerobic carrier